MWHEFGRKEIAALCFILVAPAAALLGWKYAAMQRRTYQTSNLIGVWEHTFARLGPPLNSTRVKLSITADGKFIESAYLPGQSQPIVAEGCWKLEQRGRVFLDGALAYGFVRTDTWSRDDLIFYLKESDGGIRLRGSIVPDPDSYEYWVQTGTASKSQR